MKNYIMFILVFPVVLLGSFNVLAQTGIIKKANKEYEDYSYVKTNEILLNVAEKGYGSVDLYQKLANAFYFNNKMEEASKWYGELVALENDISPEYYYRYAQSLKSIEKYKEADKWMQKFVDLKSDDLRSKAFLGMRNYLEAIDDMSKDFPIKNLNINSEVSDFGTNQYENKLIFSSSRTPGKIYKWNNQPFLDLYSAEKNETGDYDDVKKFDSKINTKYHESTVAFLDAKNMMYFTRNNFTEKDRLRRDENGVNRLKMYRVKREENQVWGKVNSVHFNSDNYSVAHPTINANGTKLYFASDMPGTYGESDLFYCDINEDGSLSRPINLGGVINTEAQETFPFINSRGDLYYSSNGLAGLGGLDVFVIRGFESKFDNNETFVVRNIGKPINSPMDDFAYYENLKTLEGFFTSNREGGKGDDDIYSFTIPECSQNIEGVVLNRKTKEILTNATVRLFNASGKEMDRMVVGEDGKYKFNNLLCNKEFLVRASKADYSTDESRIKTSGENEVVTLELELDINKVPLAKGTNLREALSLNPIYFDFDKSNIRPDAEIELQKIIAVLSKYPKMKIDVRSHTDSRATTGYNDALSNRRNISTINYIVSVGGINRLRLTGRGYGESQLANKCSDGVECSEAMHQLNRRSDFIILEL
ncbi:OmpA family protein [uncultured Algibacter sp.]|uniref:OmpA family protein n=1 Tax=uncultured Algibacter sp. TaxID=298659 RepID=UPI00321631E5